MNSAHPFENPTPLSNLLELLSILLIPAALTYTFGRMIGDTRQGWALLVVMVVVFVAVAGVTIWAEGRPNPALVGLPIDQSAGNLEGKDLRFGAAGSALWASATTAASNGSVNSMHDSFTPLGGLGPMWLMQLGEVIFGGVGSGLYGLLAFVIIAVFVAGLMVGRTPEYLGKKIEVFEMKMAALIVLIPVVTVLLGTALAVVAPAGIAGIFNKGPQGFSEVLYAFSSAGNNNGSAFAGLGANSPFYNTVLGIAMLIARFWLVVPVLAMAGSLAAKKRVPASAGTLPDPLATVRQLAGRRRAVGRRAELPARPGARADCTGVDAWEVVLMSVELRNDAATLRGRLYRRALQDSFVKARSAAPGEEPGDVRDRSGRADRVDLGRPGNLEPHEPGRLYRGHRIAGSG